MSMPRRISQGWIAQKKTLLGCTAKQVGGEPNPNYTALQDEIAAAEAELTRWQEFESWVATTKGMRLNAYPLRTQAQTFEAGKVFMHKDKVTGKVTYLTITQAWELYEAR